MRKSFFLVCPRCGSTNVENDLSRDMLAWGGSTRKMCRNCNYSSIVIPEMRKEELKVFKKKIQKRKAKDRRRINETEISKGFTNKTLDLLLSSWYVFFIIFCIIYAFMFFFSRNIMP